MSLRNIFNFIPEVRKPEEKKLSFKIKLRWTLIILGTFFVLANVSLFGLSVNALERFEYLAIILGTDFGSIISLGIGPIVMASIILQLLTGAGIINIDTTTIEGQKFFQGVQKILVFFFIIFESVIYVVMNALQANEGFMFLVIFQLILGGLAIFYMDEVCKKWGFGSGISLFIGAGVSWRIITSAFQFVNQQGQNCLLDFQNTACAGKIFVLIQALINKYPVEFISASATIVSTIIIFLIVVWVQSLKVEIPLSFGRIRGYGIKWPLSFFYASVIPVILAAALVAQIQMVGGILENWLGHPTILGHFVNGQAISGFAFWIGSTNLLELFIRGGFAMRYLIQGFTHVFIFAILSMVFSIVWVKTAGMDAKSQAHKISASGLQVAGFRQDNRILESILDRYIMPLTVMGGLAVGLLASITNLLGALVSGTAILLVIMIMYQFYQQIAKDHMEDMNPAMKKFMGSL
jgi:preprotein translocase subunit SecY